MFASERMAKEDASVELSKPEYSIRELPAMYHDNKPSAHINAAFTASSPVSSCWMDLNAFSSELAIRRRLSVLGRVSIVAKFPHDAYLLWVGWAGHVASVQTYLGGVSETTASGILAASTVIILGSSVAFIFDKRIRVAAAALVVTFILQGIAENRERTQVFWLYLIIISWRLFIADTDASLNRKRDAFLAAKRLESVHRRYKLVSSLRLRHAAQTVFGIVVGFTIMHLVGITLPVTHMALSALALFTAVAMWLAIGAGVRRAVAVTLCVSIVTFLSWWNPVYAGQDQRQVLARNWGTVAFWLLISNCTDYVVEETNALPI